MRSYFILGWGRSGKATSYFLREQGQKICVWDDDPKNREDALKEGFNVSFPNSSDSLTDVICSPGIAFYGQSAHPFFHQIDRSKVRLRCDIDLFFEFFPQTRAIGITGSNGKSTTCFLIQQYLLQQKISCTIAGNFGIPIFSVAKHSGIYILELSSYQLELSHSLPLIGAGILNLIPHHIERHQTLDNYLDAKLRIFGNAQHKFMDTSLQNRGTGNISAQSLPLERADSSCQFSFQSQALAISLIESLGFPIKDGSVFSEIPSLAHRQQVYRTVSGITYVNDSKATNPHSVVYALEKFGDGLGTVFWIGGGVRQQDDLSVMNPFLGRVHKAFLIGESAQRYAQHLKEHQTCCELSLTLDRALDAATHQALLHAPCIILFSPGCASFDQFHNFEHRGHCFMRWIDDFWSLQKSSSGGGINYARV